MRGVAYFINFKWETKDTVFYSSLFFNQDSRGAAMYNKRAKKKRNPPGFTFLLKQMVCCTFNNKHVWKVSKRL